LSGSCVTGLTAARVPRARERDCDRRSPVPVRVGVLLGWRGTLARTLPTTRTLQLSQATMPPARAPLLPAVAEPSGMRCACDITTDAQRLYGVRTNVVENDLVEPTKRTITTTWDVCGYYWSGDAALFPKPDGTGSKAHAGLAFLLLSVAFSERWRCLFVAAGGHFVRHQASGLPVPHGVPDSRPRTPCAAAGGSALFFSAGMSEGRDLVGWDVEPGASPGETTHVPGRRTAAPGKRPAGLDVGGCRFTTSEGRWVLHLRPQRFVPSCLASLYVPSPAGRTSVAYTLYICVVVWAAMVAYPDPVRPGVGSPRWFSRMV